MQTLGSQPNSTSHIALYSRCLSPIWYYTKHTAPLLKCSVRYSRGSSQCILGIVRALPLSLSPFYFSNALLDALLCFTSLFLLSRAFLPGCSTVLYIYDAIHLRVLQSNFRFSSLSLCVYELHARSVYRDPPTIRAPFCVVDNRFVIYAHCTTRITIPQHIHQSKESTIYPHLKIDTSEYLLY